MEIKRFMDLYKKHDPKIFFNWLSRGKVMEVRFLSDYNGVKFKDWDLIKTLAYKVNAEFRFNSLFINEYKQLHDILMFRINGVAATKLFNIFIGANPKRKIHVKSKNGLIYKSYQGSIASTSYIQNAVCDIETKTHKSKSATESELEECIQGAKYLVKLYDLKNYFINISSNGVHLWVAFEEPIELPTPNYVELPDKLKYKMKEEPIISFVKKFNRFIENLNDTLQKYNPDLVVDEGAKDISRVARPPGSWNVKVERIPRAVGTVECCITEEKGIPLGNTINTLFSSVILQSKIKKNPVYKNAVTTNKYRYNYLNIREAPIVQLLLSRLLPSILSRNHYLENSLARLLRDNNINTSEIQDLIEEINSIQNKNIQIDPDYLEDLECFNPEMVNSYCIGSKIDLVYPILDDVPEVNENFIDEKRYDSWNSYSWSTVDRSKCSIAINIKKPNSYLELKDLIRHFVQSYDKTTVFFIIKALYKDEWEYYDKNRIIQQLLNKVRRLTNGK